MFEQFDGFELNCSSHLTDVLTYIPEYVIVLIITKLALFVASVYGLNCI